MPGITHHIASATRRIVPSLRSLRRELHQYPEPAFQEKQTAAILSQFLKNQNIESTSGVAGTGIICSLRGQKGGNTVALRADMDALPISERTGLSYQSKHRGLMHACGHDMHMACVMGAGLLLQDLLKDLKGRVKLIFQPAEELPPGGAIKMIEAGVLQRPPVDAIFGLHTAPLLNTGTVAMRDGVMMGTSGAFEITIHGKGGHGAFPHLTIDPITIAAEVIQNLQTIVSRNVDPLQAGVISIGMIRGGRVENVIPESVDLHGTWRALSAEVAAMLPRRIQQVIRNIVRGHGARCSIKMKAGYPMLNNHSGATQFAREQLAKVPGVKRVESCDPIMGVEDFAFYLQRVPGTFFWLGVGNPKQPGQFLHSPYYQPAEAALSVGIQSLTYLAYQYLKTGPHHKGF